MTEKIKNYILYLHKKVQTAKKQNSVYVFETQDEEKLNELVELINNEPFYIEFESGEKYFGLSDWEQKTEGAIFVKNEKDILPLFKILCEQDDYWEDYKHLIKVLPMNIRKKGDLNFYCDYTGKTDIFNIEDLKKQIPFIIHQFKKISETIYYS